MERFNEAATWLAGVACEHKITRTFDLHHVAYRDLREKFGLPADMACRCLAQVCDAYKRDKAKRPAFRKHAAVPYSMGKNVGFKGVDRVSISTLAGRVVVPFVMGKYQADRFALKKGQCDLVLRKDGKWFLIVTVDVPEGTPVAGHGLPRGRPGPGEDRHRQRRQRTLRRGRRGGEAQAQPPAASGWAGATARGRRRKRSGSRARKPGSARHTNHVIFEGDRRHC